jgi:predicted nucleotidyltransferase
VSNRQELTEQRAAYVASLRAEAEQRIAAAAAALGAEQVILFGSLVEGEPGLLSDLDLMIVWDTPLDFVARTVDIYKRLDPHGPVDILVYTPAEIQRMADRPFIRTILEKGTTLYGP